MPAAKSNGHKPGRVIDLDRARAARAESQGEPVVLKFGGKDFALPVEMPLDFPLLAKEGQIREAVAALFSPEDAEAFFALRPSMEDITELAEASAKVYGVESGEAQASPSS